MTPEERLANRQRANGLVEPEPAKDSAPEGHGDSVAVAEVGVVERTDSDD